MAIKNCLIQLYDDNVVATGEILSAKWEAFTRHSSILYRSENYLTPSYFTETINASLQVKSTNIIDKSVRVNTNELIVKTDHTPQELWGEQIDFLICYPYFKTQELPFFFATELVGNLLSCHCSFEIAVLEKPNNKTQPLDLDPKPKRILNS